MTLLVEGVCQSTESLLAGSIPDLDGDSLCSAGRSVILRDVIESQGGHVRGLKLFLVVHFEERCLAYSCIAEYNNAHLFSHVYLL